MRRNHRPGQVSGQTPIRAILKNGSESPTRAILKNGQHTPTGATLRNGSDSLSKAGLCKKSEEVNGATAPDVLLAGPETDAGGTEPRNLDANHDGDVVALWLEPDQSREAFPRSRPQGSLAASLGWSNGTHNRSQDGSGGAKPPSIEYANGFPPQGP